MNGNANLFLDFLAKMSAKAPAGIQLLRQGFASGIYYTFEINSSDKYTFI